MLRITMTCIALAVLTISPAPAAGHTPASKPASRPAATRPALPAQAGVWTQVDLLRRITDLDRLMTPPPAGEITGMFSSYDRAAKIVGGKRENWYANDDRGHYLKDAADGWKVMAEIDGAGAITRIWADRPAGDLRVLIDGKAVIDGPFLDLFRGLVPPFASPLAAIDETDGGANCYFPLGFAKRCEIQAKAYDGAYQVNYVTFGNSAKVEAFEKKLTPEGQKTLDEVAHAFVHGYSQKELFGGRKMKSATQGPTRLQPKEKLTDGFQGAGIVRAVYVRVTPFAASRDPRGLHRCVLRMFFDGKTEPDVEAPLPDFFGSGFGRAEFESLPVGTHTLVDVPFAEAQSPKAWENVFMYNYFPMPYQNGMSFEIENFGDGPVELMVILRVDRATPAADGMRFHARYKREDPAPADYVVLDTTGTARFVGLMLNVDTPRNEPWTEGDETVFIGKKADYRGTGSADLLGSAEPLHVGPGALRGVTRTGTFGKSSGFRWFMPDCIQSRDGLRFELATPSALGKKDTYYGSVAYWYSDAAAAAKFERLAAAHVTPPGLRIPNSVEIEGNVLTVGASNEVKQKHAGLELSGEAAESIASKDWVDVRIPWKAAGRYWLRLHVNPREPFETIEMRTATKDKVGEVKWTRDAGGYYDIGWVELTAGDNKFQVKCTGQPQLDCWILETNAPPPPAPKAEPPTSQPTEPTDPGNESGE